MSGKSGKLQFNGELDTARLKHHSAANPIVIGLDHNALINLECDARAMRSDTPEAGRSTSNGWLLPINRTRNAAITRPFATCAGNIRAKLATADDAALQPA